MPTNFRAAFKLGRMLFCAPVQKHKIGNTGSHSGFFGPMNLRKEKKLSAFRIWTAMNVTSVETWMNFNQVLQTEDSMKIVFIFFKFVNVCMFLLCIASWKLEQLIAQ